MVSGRHCTFSLRAPWQEQFSSFVSNAGSHVLVAGVVNGVFLCSIGSGDLLPGILVGASVGLSQNITHKVVHVLSSREKESCHLSLGMEVVIAALMIYGMAHGLLRAFEYNLEKREIIQLGVVGMVSVAFYNHFQKD